MSLYYDAHGFMRTRVTRGGRSTRTMLLGYLSKIYINQSTVNIQRAEERRRVWKKVADREKVEGSDGQSEQSLATPVPRLFPLHATEGYKKPSAPLFVLVRDALASCSSLLYISLLFTYFPSTHLPLLQ